MSEGEPDPDDEQLAALLAQVRPQDGGPLPLLAQDQWPAGLQPGATR